MQEYQHNPTKLPNLLAAVKPKHTSAAQNLPKPALFLAAVNPYK